MTESTNGLKRKMRSKKPEPKERAGLSTGLTVLNLALTGRPSAGYLTGHYYWFVGDSQSGKTAFVMTTLAEAAANPAFDGHRLVYDNVEEGLGFDVQRYFGKRLADRLEPPAGTKDDPRYSTVVEEFYYHLNAALKQGPCVYVLDSQDGLDSEAATKKFDANMRAWAKANTSENGDAEDLKGSYGDGKAKAHSGNLRRFIRPLERSGSILVIVSQTRDDLKAKYGSRGTVAGGRALKFYANAQVWTSVREDILGAAHGEDRVRKGGVIRISVEKNRHTGKERVVYGTLYDDTGIDDVGSCVDYLVRSGHWKAEGKVKVLAPEFGDFSGKRETLIRKIEEAGDERKLRLLVAEVWGEQESKLEVRRKPRYE